MPHALGLRLTQLCLIRGIRYHYGFAQELRGTTDEFTRALNARSIMNNIILDISLEKPEDIPYCIWFPDVPSEKTCRELAKRYPQMLYHVGRTCAVAGYTNLYMELDILPEVHIAEEARQCGSMDIYDAIMAKSIKYSVMDDYTRVVDVENPKPAFLNGDTAVRKSLELKQKFYVPVIDMDDTDWLWFNDGYETNETFNITEDMSIDEYDGMENAHKVEEDVTHLLYTPLPVDLPTINKDLLILMAAYHGNIDRYARLRRPKMIRREKDCVLRGIYHNTFFAKWWSLQDSEVAKGDIYQNAITARFIMNNDLSRVTKDLKSFQLPYVIYSPDLAQATTYGELARRKPDMLPQVLRGCIRANYQTLFDSIVEKVDLTSPLSRVKLQPPLYRGPTQANGRLKYRLHDDGERWKYRERILEDCCSNDRFSVLV